ncbi:SH3 domain-containing protein [Lachnoanaerobaculum gingivalis]|uniref:SH3 domain-containing protein n=1 Tax=Lachnoanaerobaculum gingivalis TaxID=2490855 RepID=A0A3P3R0X4_9FIRM|nr:SH3 domain-containing protein [Lachnoanaerobaculum gingivalis]RRJ26658.1 SH3 domain-containing protein [Lachnoanaerobaculum gingivalis]
MRKIIYLICVLTSICILSGCGSKSITIKFGGDTETVVESKDESETEEESNIAEMSAVQETVAEVTQSAPLQETQPQTAAVTQAQVLTTLYVVNCNESITLRVSDSTNAKEIRQIPLGAAVSFMENAANGFYKVSYNGSTGYALASYLSVDPYDHYVASTTSSTVWAGKVVRCNEYITLRRIPSTKGEEITKIPLGSIVTVYSGAENGFYYINYDGMEGYALAVYIDAY